MDLSKAKANFPRVCQLLVDKGSDALRAALHAIHPPSTLAAALNANKSVLQRIRHSVITDYQWNLLFPTSGTPDSHKFDITSLTILLRNICRLPKPVTGWNVMPLAGDTSKSADLVRIKFFRNEVHGHIASAQLDDATFEKLWQEISTTLTRLGIPQKDIDEIKVAPISPEEESYIEKLKKWKERDDYILSKLNNVENEVSNWQKTVENMFPSQRNPGEWEPTSCLPDRSPMFTGRKVEIHNVIAFLIDKESAVVSLHGGPGFGKTAIAIEVSHQLSEENNIPVVFSQLTTATTADEMIRQLCLDVGVNHEDDPNSSFVLWLRSIKSKVIFVMDDIDNLLEEKSSFYGFIRLLRKNSNQYCQIVTTSRMFREISDLPTDKVQVDEMDNEACIELLKKQCLQRDDKFLRKLAELCGNIPLAMCIAGSLVDEFENSDELLLHLEKQPMKILKRPNSNQYVNRAINLSYEKCSDEEQEMFMRLSIFEGSFSKIAARAAIEKDNFDTADILQKLVSRSLIKQLTKHHYSIHLLIKHFLNDAQKSGEEKAQKARAEAMCAKVLIVEYYLKFRHQLTMKSYSKDGYKDSRETLKREASNIQNVLKICCQQEDARSDISDCLAHSKIYTISAKFFSLFVGTIIPESIVDNFLERCANLAEERKEYAIKINVNCLLADRERSKSIGRSDEDFISKMERIKKDFETHYEVLKEDKSLCAHYYLHYGGYVLRQAQNRRPPEKLELQIQAREQFQKALKLREMLTDTSEGKADKVFTLLRLGSVCKLISASKRVVNRKNKAAIEIAWKQARKYCEEAVQLSQENLGEHELTSSCYKNLGDLLFIYPELAEKNYTIAKKMRENLRLDASERHVFLLNNLGRCLSKTSRANKAIEVLESARDTAEKLAKIDAPNVCKTKVYTSLAVAYYLVSNSDKSDKCFEETVRYAKKAMEFGDFRQIKKILTRGSYEKLLRILKLTR